MDESDSGLRLYAAGVTQGLKQPSMASCTTNIREQVCAASKSCRVLDK